MFYTHGANYILSNLLVLFYDNFLPIYFIFPSFLDLLIWILISQNCPKFSDFISDIFILFCFIFILLYFAFVSCFACCEDFSDLYITLQLDYFTYTHNTHTFFLFVFLLYCVLFLFYGYNIISYQSVLQNSVFSLIRDFIKIPFVYI